MVGATVTGISGTIRALGKYEGRVRRDVNVALKAGAILVSKDAIRRAPRRTGTLARSIRIAVDKKKMIAIVGSGLEYSIYQELGTRKMQANPYLGPALLNNQAEILSLIKNATKLKGEDLRRGI